MKNKDKMRSYAVLVSLVVSIGGLLLGMSTTIGGALEFFKIDFVLSPIEEGLTVSAAMFGTFVGNFFAGNISDSIGRKKSLFLAAILFSFLSLGSAVSPNFIMLFITRMIGGVGLGISLLVAPMYIAEFSPSKHRGFLVSFNQLNIGIGFLLAAISNTIVDSVVVNPEMKWRLMLGVTTIFPIIYIILLFFIPESPRWLIERKRDEEAKKIMAKAGGVEHSESEYVQIKQSMSNGSTDKDEKISYGERWKILFSKPMRRIVVVAFSIMIFQMLSGLNNVFFFGPKIFKLLGANEIMSPFMLANIPGLVMVVMTIVAMSVIDKLGRKPLLYIGVSLIAIASLMIGLAFNSAQYSIEKEGIANIEQSLIDNSLRTEARNINKKAYGIDSMRIDSNIAYLYKKNQNDVGATELAIVDLNTESIVKAKSDAEVVKNILLRVEGEVFENELEYFSTIKTSINENKEQLFNKDIYIVIKDMILDSSIKVNSILVLIGIALIVIGFSISLGPIAWAMLAEIFPGKIRGLGVSIAGALNALASNAVAILFPIELEHLGSATTFFIFGGFMVICLFFVATIYPETKGKTLEEIEKEMLKLPKATSEKLEEETMLVS